MMIEMTLFGIGILVVMGTWRWMARPTFLDEARDRLFDLRDDVLRAKFAELPNGLQHPLYQSLRRLINGHLRYTESSTLIGLVSMLVWMRQNHDAAEEIQERHNQEFQTNDEELSRFSARVRQRAAVIMLAYTLKTSLIAWFLLLFVLCIAFIRKLWRICSGGTQIAAVLTSTAAVASITALIAPNAGHDAAQSAMEERALQTLGHA